MTTFGGAEARRQTPDGAPGSEGRAPGDGVPVPAPGTVDTFRPDGKVEAGTGCQLLRGLKRGEGCGDSRGCNQ